MLQDHAFGDVEMFWSKDNKEIAYGYFSGAQASVRLSPVTLFEGDAARTLMACGSIRNVDRNCGYVG